MAKGHMIADATAIIGTIDLVLGDVRTDNVECQRAIESRKQDRPRSRQVSGRPEAVGGDGGAGHRPGRKGLAVQGDHRGRRRLPRHGADGGLRSGELLQHVRPAPVGKYKITVCTNLPCALSGGVHAADYLKQKLGIDFNETTADGKFTLKEGECMGACGDAPVMLVNNVRMCSFMQPEQIDKLLAECK
jgi:hypothetical protein